MPLVHGQAISYSPLLYRAPERWADIRGLLVGDVPQPAAAGVETAERLAAYAARIDAGFARAAERLAAARLDALVVLVADQRRLFDASNTPQLHVFVGDTIWGDTARAEVGEAPARTTFSCDAAIAGFLAEELAYHGFDVSESRGVFQPMGDPERGVGEALIAPLRRLGAGLELPIVPIHINCHVAPVISGHRMAPFGTALAAALRLLPQRVGLLASGGMSGQPGEAMAGWIDDVLDTWVLARLRTGRSADLGRIFDIESQTLRGAARELRLWIAAGAALEHAGARAAIDDYIPFHHAAVGTAFMHWEM